jgi:hypothetical protein
MSGATIYDDSALGATTFMMELSRTSPFRLSAGLGERPGPNASWTVGYARAATPERRRKT